MTLSNSTYQFLISPKTPSYSMSTTKTWLSMLNHLDWTTKVPLDLKLWDLLQPKPLKGLSWSSYWYTQSCLEWRIISMMRPPSISSFMVLTYTSIWLFTQNLCSNALPWDSPHIFQMVGIGSISLSCYPLRLRKSSRCWTWTREEPLYPH